MNGDLVAARQFMAARRVDLAERHLRLALASEPDNASAHAMLAQCLIARRALAEATNEARESIRLAPTSCVGYSVLGAAQAAGHHWREAERSVREAIRLDAVDPHHWSALARTLTQQGRGKRALAAAEEGLRLRPNNFDCLNECGLALLDLGRADEARAVIRSALVSAPESAALHSNLAFVLLGNGQNAAAEEEALEALRLDPNLHVAEQNLRASQRVSRNWLTPYANRAANWWRHRPIWERMVFVGGLGVVGLVSSVAWIMAVIIGAWWLNMAARRAAASPTSPLHRFRREIAYLGMGTIFAGVLLAGIWPRQAMPVPELAGFIAPWTLLFAAALAQPRRAAVFALTLVIIAVGSVGPSWLDALPNVGPPLPNTGDLNLNLSDDQLLQCIFDFTQSQDLAAAAVGVNMFDERDFMDSVPQPEPFPSSMDDPKVVAWLDALVAAARQDQRFVDGCAVGLNEGTP